MDEHNDVDDIEKKVGNFHVLNGFLAKTRNLIFQKKEKGFPVILWILIRWRIEWSFEERLCSILRANRDFLEKNESELRVQCHELRMCYVSIET